MDKIICVGKNYLKHALELGDAVPEEPLYFLKPPSSALQLNPGHNASVVLPNRGEIHHELELVFKIKNTRGVWGFSHFTLGLDLTARELQNRLKKAGHPWEKAKVFRNSAILGPWTEMKLREEVLAIPFEIKVNGETRQKGQGRDMRWQPEELVEDLSNWFPLHDGDLLFTGTPEGVGPLKDGDHVEVSGAGLDYTFDVKVL